jgi:HSP20 family protein
MTYIKFGPGNDFNTFNKKMHNFFDEFPNIGLDINYSIKPRTDFYSDEENIYLDVEIPGVKKEDIKISLNDNVLTLSGEKKDLSKNNKNIVVIKSERNFEPFSRSFRLPEGLNTDKIEAAYEDGIVKITVARKTISTLQEKEIKIN